VLDTRYGFCDYRMASRYITGTPIGFARAVAR